MIGKAWINKPHRGKWKISARENKIKSSTMNMSRLVDAASQTVRVEDVKEPTGVKVILPLNMNIEITSDNNGLTGCREKFKGF